MEKNTKSIVLVITSLGAVGLTTLAPISKRVTQGFFNTYSDTISLFNGLNAPACTAFTTIAGVGMLLYTVIGVFNSQYNNNNVGTKIFSLFFLLMQIISLIVAMNQYDNSSLWGSIKSEAGVMSIHIACIFAILLTIVTIIMAFMVSDNDSGKKFRYLQK